VFFVTAGWKEKQQAANGVYEGYIQSIIQKKRSDPKKVVFNALLGQPLTIMF
jgi:hypothetical protein